LKKKSINFSKWASNSLASPSNINKATGTLIANLTVALEKENEAAIAQISTTVKNHPIEDLPRETSEIVKLIKRKIRDHNSCLLKADKGSTTVPTQRYK
jgi:hypothetical protein